MRYKKERREKRKVFTAVLAICLLSASCKAACAMPSKVDQDGGSVVWSVGDTRIWRFPLAYAPEVSAMSDSFNELYLRGFKLADLRVEKQDDGWCLFIGDKKIFSAKPEHGGAIRLNPHLMSLHWLSKMYEAVGDLHAKDLTAAYMLRGEYEITGSVSWYGGKFIGRRFANGERFTESHLICAAKNLPFGTLVRVTTPATGRSVVVRVTDRFKEHKNRLLDISQAAAEVLGIKRMGVAKAKFEVIGRVDNIGGL